MPGDRFAMRKLAQGYRPPWERQGCHNCAHGAEPAGAPRRGLLGAMSCTLGHFLVAPNGICPRHEIRPVARFSESSHADIPPRTRNPQTERF